uniref:hypothetical protein n=1 Tax=uncultured Altererythrobacter sp. TaxID=500840 RepID=UPI00260FA8AF|nr:hypothetical protein [uncultured Altererythrobacter sp.]
MTKNKVYWGIGRAFMLVLSIACLGFTPANAVAQDGGWTLEPSARVEAGVVSAETATRDEQIVVDGDALTFRGQLAFDLEDEDTRFRLEVDRIEVVRLGDGRRDSNRNRITAQFDQELSDDWDIQLRGRYYDDLVTAESSDTDEVQGSVRVTYEPERAHRFRARATWRKREYDNGTGGEQTTGEGPRIDVQYRHRLGRYHYVTLDARAEEINSDDPRRGYQRQSAKVSYTHPLTRDLRVRPAVEYLNTKFDGRLTEAGARRNDELFVPEVELLWWPGQWRIEAEAKYITSSSNLSTRDREGYRLTLTVGYAL